MYLPDPAHLRVDLGFYWRFHFRDDLHRVMEARPPVGDHGEGPFIQPYTFSRKNAVVRSWGPMERERIAVCLYLMLRLDGYVRLRRPNRYGEFAAAFGAPRFLGDCPGGCWMELAPESALYCLGVGGQRWQDRVPVVPDTEWEGNVAGIVRRVVVERLPESDAERFVVGFMEDWRPGVVLDALAGVE